MPERKSHVTGRMFGIWHIPAHLWKTFLGNLFAQVQTGLNVKEAELNYDLGINSKNVNFLAISSICKLAPNISFIQT